MGEESTCSGFYYTPRANRGNGTIENFELYVSHDGSDWGKAVVTGSFSEHDQGGESFEVPVRRAGHGALLQVRGHLSHVR